MLVKTYVVASTDYEDVITHVVGFFALIYTWRCIIHIVPNSLLLICLSNGHMDSNPNAKEDLLCQII